MSIKQASTEHEVAYQDLLALLNKHSGKLTALEMLAIAANMVGKLAAMQDQRKVTPSMAMEIISKNMEHGNQQVVNLLNETKGSA